MGGSTSAGHVSLRRRVRAGDEEAFAELYAANASAVFNLAWRLTGNRGIAEDVTSETFLVAWKSRASILMDDGATNDQSLTPWLLGIATHQAMNATRSVRRRLAFLAKRPGQHVVDDFADSAASRVDDARDLARTQRALRSLSRTEAEVIGLCVWSGLSYAEAAVALNIPIGTVRSRLSRARKRLRQLVDTGTEGASK